ncbi:MAG: hypothetical protein PHN18_02125 [Sulfurospirillaceae bacterium]|jgi:hypothetical protein|nr:hypothetical protein [Sulfurospirillaceae bacterium]MDD2826589.1 hypothetical protein [Sulfurospirillaceae bacterium]
MKMFKLLLVALACLSRLSAGDIYEGVVVDTLNGGGYTYLYIEDAKKKYWVAVEGVQIDKGMEVRFTEEMRVKNFESKSLNRTFDEIVFASNLQYRTKTPQTAHLALITEMVKVSPYKQKDTLSVAEAYNDRVKLNGTTIKIRGKVVKFSENIIGRNWIHIQDGTGIDNEVGRIVFTSTESHVKVGDIVTATGVVSVDKNFGSGYVYKIIAENASFQK